MIIPKQPSPLANPANHCRSFNFLFLTIRLIAGLIFLNSFASCFFLKSYSLTLLATLFIEVPS